ncbi:hypothetical protein OpiT1DRAFT_02715 [Opitutaceae bacterium TAV1]|nr:hypothetical protein OPIT5_12685 [Opitutaceae bacterium TAV5]EIP98262.1 hypothetical protein OpiT1DRAFT_02715 [Opitutaceae bacterium TAV1]
MKTRILKPLAFAATLALGSVFATVPAARAAYLFYTFDTAQDGNGAFTLAASGNDGFASAPEVVYSGGKLSETGGSAAYTDPEENTWSGSGGAATPGHSIGWGNGTGNFFYVILNMTGLKDLKVKFDIRSAGSSIPTAFTSIIHRVDDANPTAINVPLTFPTGDNRFYTWTADFSSVTAINNQSFVKLIWYIPNISSSASLRIDNLEFTAVAIPEPSASVAALAGVIGLCVVMWRRLRH